MSLSIKSSLLRQSIRNGKVYTHSSSIRFIHQSAKVFAKNDPSTIDSYKLPSQTSINEWEFKYDFIPKVSQPKIPPITPEAVRQDIAHEKKASVEKEMFNKEGAASIKVEANDAPVVHGGEQVKDEPEFLHDRGSKPIDVTNKQSNVGGKKPVNSEKYVQTSVNPNINKSDVVNLSENEVDHKVTPIDKQEQIIDDIEHDKIADAHPKLEANNGKSNTGLLAVVGLGGAIGGYYFYNSTKSTKK